MHMYPVFSLQKSQPVLKDYKGETLYPTFGGLQFDDPALEPYGDGVRAVVRSQLLENVADVAFHRILPNRKLGELVAQVSTGREAIEQFRRHRPDITLMDPPRTGSGSMIQA